MSTVNRSLRGTDRTTKGHEKKLKKKLIKIDVKYFFNIIVDERNKQNDEIMNADSLLKFKKLYDS